MSAEFSFTIADVDASEDNLHTTIAMLSFVSKPKLSEKLMKRPPFRFLHNLISSIMTHTQYRPKLFTGDDLVWRSRSKERKRNYLEKIRYVVSADMGIGIVLNPNKVCAGKLCHETRTFLQYLALAAHRLGDRIRVMRSRRQWLRAIWRSEFHPTSTNGQYESVPVLSATDQLLQFFKTFPGLRRLVGKVVSLYVQPPDYNVPTAELLAKYNNGPPPAPAPPPTTTTTITTTSITTEEDEGRYGPPSPLTTTTTTYTTTIITAEDEEGELFINKLS